MINCWTRPLDCGLLSGPDRRSFRTMLPLNAEFKRAIAYRITKEGQLALHLAGMSGSSARSRRTPEEQAAEFRVLDYLAAQEPVAGGDDADPRGDSALRHSRFQINSERDGAQEVDCARRYFRGPRRHAHHQDRAAQIGRRKTKRQSANSWLRRWLRPEAGFPSRALQALEVPRTTLGTLVRRGLVEIVEEPAGFAVSRSKPRSSLCAIRFQFRAASCTQTPARSG